MRVLLVLLILGKALSGSSQYLGIGGGAGFGTPKGLHTRLYDFYGRTIIGSSNSKSGTYQSLNFDFTHPLNKWQFVWDFNYLQSDFPCEFYYDNGKPTSKIHAYMKMTSVGALLQHSFGKGKKWYYGGGLNIFFQSISGDGVSVDSKYNTVSLNTRFKIRYNIFKKLGVELFVLNSIRPIDYSKPDIGLVNGNYELEKGNLMKKYNLNVGLSIKYFTYFGNKRD